MHSRERVDFHIIKPWCPGQLRALGRPDARHPPPGRKYIETADPLVLTRLLQGGAWAGACGQWEEDGGREEGPGRARGEVGLTGATSGRGPRDGMPETGRLGNQVLLMSRLWRREV